MGRRDEKRRRRGRTPRKRSKRRSTSSEETPPIWFGAVFVIAGGFVAAVGLKWIEVDPSSVHAPYWVLTVIGGVFALAGVMCYTRALGERLNGALGLVLLGLFATPFTWVAFGSGERQFSGGVSVGPVGAGGAIGETIGRIGFGFGAVLMWLVFFAAAARYLKSFSS